MSDTLYEKFLSQSYFNYEYIPEFTEKKMNKFVQSAHNRFVKETKNWSEEKNTIWLLKLYASIKMLLGATVFYSNYEFSEERKIYFSLPYLEYYGLLSSCRALMLLTEDKDFSKVFEASHKKIINITKSTLHLIDEELAENFYNHIMYLKKKRETFSYHLPTREIDNPENSTFFESIYFSKILGEITQLLSEILEFNASKTDVSTHTFCYHVVYEDIKKYFNSQEDSYRISYIRRKIKVPSNIFIMATEGLTEDFLYTFMGEYLEENELGPLYNLQLIFPFM